MEDDLDCGDCLERLYAYLDRELAPKESSAVRTHLDECVGCEDNFAVEERFLKLVRDCCTEDVAPNELRNRIVTRLRTEGGAPR